MHIGEDLVELGVEMIVDILIGINSWSVGADESI